jgi:hypothetical protein
VPTVTLVPPHRLAASPREVKLLQHFAADVARCSHDIAALAMTNCPCLVDQCLVAALATTLVIHHCSWGWHIEEGAAGLRIVQAPAIEQTVLTATDLLVRACC